MQIDRTIVTSFVHGYEDLDFNDPEEVKPSLWCIGKEEKVYSYPFPRNVEDFNQIGSLLAGKKPLAGAKNFKKLPRYGLTGLSQTNEHIFAGTWNAVYQIKKDDFSLEKIISNQLMNDMHGIWADGKSIITILTGKDTVVFTDFDGTIIDHFTIDNQLNVFKNEALEEIDWRFLSKQFRGATGRWHLNYVQRFDNEIWLTARNLGAFIVVNLDTKKAHIRAMNQKTTVLLHDGVKVNDEYYFTSIDGKVLIATDAESATFNTRDEFEGVDKFDRDMICELIRLEETEFGREPNWCRGIDCKDDIMYLSVDGRYDTDLSFGVIALKRNGEMIFEKRLKWSDVGSEATLRYVTGFDIICY